MPTICSIYLIFVAMIVMGWVILQAYRGRSELISTRNFFLAGFVVFQLTGAATNMLTDHYGFFAPQNLTKTPAIYCVFATAFLIFFGLFYGIGWPAKKLAWKLQLKPVATGSAGLLTLAIAFCGAGLVLRLGLMHVPLLGAGFNMLGSGLLACAAGMAAWAWVPRLWNPVVGAMAAGVIVLALFGTLFYSFGRRDILGVLACAGWGAYHGYWKHLGFRAAFMRLSGVALAGLIALGAFTAVREGDFRERTAMQIVGTLKNADVSSGVMDVLFGQNAGPNSMWLIEQRMGTGQYDLLHTARMVLEFPIPREYYPAKPVALAISMPDEARIKHVPENWNIGPGIVGHIVNDNPWVAFFPYVFFLAFYFRFLDEVVIVNPYNPFAVLPMGVALGQIVGIARGESSTFFILSFVYVVGSFFSMLAIYQVVKFFGWVLPEEVEEEEAYEDDGWEWYADDPSAT